MHSLYFSGMSKYNGKIEIYYEHTRCRIPDYGLSISQSRFERNKIFILLRSSAPEKTRRYSAAEPLAGLKLPPLAAAAARSNVCPAQSQQNYGFVFFAGIK